MKALVVDDEPLVRSELVYTLQRVADGCLVSEAQSGIEALDLLYRSEFDIVFLDVRMPGLSGLEAAASIAKNGGNPPVVFVTAHENYAVRAFEVAAFDYLLKPVTEERLSATLQRLGFNAGTASLSKGAKERIAVKAGERTLLVAVEDIRFVQARGHVVTVALFEQVCRMRHTLRESFDALETHGFMRTHRAYLANPAHVLEVVPFVAGAYALRMNDRARSEIPVSRNFAPAVRAALEAVGWTGAVYEA